MTRELLVNKRVAPIKFAMGVMENYLVMGAGFSEINNASKSSYKLQTTLQVN